MDSPVSHAYSEDDSAQSIAYSSDNAADAAPQQQVPQPSSSAPSSSSSSSSPSSSSESDSYKSDSSRASTPSPVEERAGEGMLLGVLSSLESITPAAISAAGLTEGDVRNLHTGLTEMLTSAQLESRFGMRASSARMKFLRLLRPTDFAPLFDPDRQPVRSIRVSTARGSDASYMAIRPLGDVLFKVLLRADSKNFDLYPDEKFDEHGRVYGDAASSDSWRDQQRKDDAQWKRDCAAADAAHRTRPLRPATLALVLCIDLTTMKTLRNGAFVPAYIRVVNYKDGSANLQLACAVIAMLPVLKEPAVGSGVANEARKREHELVFQRCLRAITEEFYKLGVVDWCLADDPTVYKFRVRLFTACADHTGAQQNMNATVSPTAPVASRLSGAPSSSYAHAAPPLQSLADINKYARVSRDDRAIAAASLRATGINALGRDLPLATLFARGFAMSEIGVVTPVDAMHNTPGGNGETMCHETRKRFVKERNKVELGVRTMALQPYRVAWGKMTLPSRRNVLTGADTVNEMKAHVLVLLPSLLGSGSRSILTGPDGDQLLDILFREIRVLFALSARSFSESALAELSRLVANARRGIVALRRATVKLHEREYFVEIIRILGAPRVFNTRVFEGDHVLLKKLAELVGARGKKPQHVRLLELIAARDLAAMTVRALDGNLRFTHDAVTETGLPLDGSNYALLAERTQPATSFDDLLQLGGLVPAGDVFCTVEGGGVGGGRHGRLSKALARHARVPLLELVAVVAPLRGLQWPPSRAALKAWLLQLEDVKNRDETPRRYGAPDIDKYSVLTLITGTRAVASLTPAGAAWALCALGVTIFRGVRVYDAVGTLYRLNASGVEFLSLRVELGHALAFPGTQFTLAQLRQVFFLPEVSASFYGDGAAVAAAVDIANGYDVLCARHLLDCFRCIPDCAAQRALSVWGRDVVEPWLRDDPASLDPAVSIIVDFSLVIRAEHVQPRYCFIKAGDARVPLYRYPAGVAGGICVPFPAVDPEEDLESVADEDEGGDDDENEAEEEGEGDVDEDQAGADVGGDDDDDHAGEAAQGDGSSSDSDDNLLILRRSKRVRRY